MKKIIISLAFILAACDTNFRGDTVYDVEYKDHPIMTEQTKVMYPKMPVRTSENAANFSLQLPYRCEVNWEDQKIVKTESFDKDRFEILNVSKGDDLPLFMVKSFSTDAIPVDQAFKKLFDKTKIKVKGNDPIYPIISMPETDGMVDVVLDMMSELSQIYYSFDKKTNTIYLSREAKFEIAVPLSNEAILSVVDSMYGIGIRDVNVDWEDKVIRFKGNKIVEKEVKNLVKKMGEEKTLIVYDVNVYRINPKNGAVKWMDLLNSFKSGTIKSENTGAIGKLLVADSQLSVSALENFLKQRGKLELLSQGSFTVPNRWEGRLDVGSCSRKNSVEQNLIVLASGKYEQSDWKKDRLNVNFYLKNKKDDIASYDVVSRLGENFVIIGIPTHYFVEDVATTISPDDELVMFVSPRIINIVDMRKTDEEQN